MKLCLRRRFPDGGSFLFSTNWGLLIVTFTVSHMAQFYSAISLVTFSGSFILFSAGLIGADLEWLMYFIVGRAIVGLVSILPQWLTLW